MMYRTILLAADGSPSSLKAAKAVGDLARLLPDSTVTVLYVLHVPPVLASNLDIPVDRMIRNTARDVLATTVQALDLPAVNVSTEVQIGDPATEIVDMARLVPFDLIAMGTRGLSPFKEMMVGSVSHKVANTASCPVLLVR